MSAHSYSKSSGLPALMTAAASLMIFAFAGNGIAYGEPGNTPNAASLIEALKSKGASRGVASVANADLIKSLKSKTSRGISISSEEREKVAEMSKKLPAYDMEILFEFNSDKITPDAKPAIEALGKALQDNQLKGSSFLLAGHTDAKGGTRYNQTLSERRAKAVKKILVNEFNLDNEQLIPVGYGLQNLKNAKDPYADENRRVQIVNLGE